MRKAFLSTLLSIALFCSCSKEEREFKLNSEGLKYLPSRTNQYFIYKDSASGHTDSVVVTEASLTTEEFTYTFWGGEPTKAKREVYNLMLTRKGLANDSVWLKATAVGDLAGQFDMEEVTSKSRVFFYPANCIICTNILSFPSISIEGVTYSDVVAITNVFINNYSYDFYWARGVGLIKLVKMASSSSNTGPGNQTYFLLRHN